MVFSLLICPFCFRAKLYGTNGTKIIRHSSAYDGLPILMLTLTYLRDNVSVDHGTEGGLCDKRVEASRLAQVSHVLRVKVIDPGIGMQTMERTEHSKMEFPYALI